MVIHKNYLLFAITLCATAVILGAFGAHMLKDILAADSLRSFNTGVRYQMTHGLSIILIVLFSNIKSLKLGTILNLMSLGIVFFSFSIFLLSLNNIWSLDWIKYLGPVTPVGGLLLICSWVLLFIKVLRLK